MTIVRCPSCHDEVTAPASASVTARVQCPLCQDEYNLGDALAQLPPALILLDGHDPQDLGLAEMSAAGDLDESLEFAGAGGGDFAFGEQPATTATSGSGSTRPRRRKQKNMAFEMIKIVLGGVVGLVLAVLILWWGIKDDPFTLGPMVSRVLPQIVPAQFQHPDVRAARNGEEPPEANGGNGTNPSPGNPGGGLSPPRDLSTAPNPLNNPGGTNPGGTNPGDLPGPPDTSPPPFDPAPTDGPNTDEPKVDPVDIDPPSIDPPNPAVGGGPDQVIGVKNAKIRTAGELAEAVQEAGAAKTRFEEAEPGDQAKERIGFYKSLAALGEVVTFVDQDDQETPGHVSQVHDLLGTLGSHREMIGTMAASWLKHASSRETEGVLLAGKVTEIRPVGKLFETKVQLTGAEGPSGLVSVINRFDPGTTYKVGAELTILGAIVENPRRELGGYKGSDKQVIMAGYLIPQ